MVAAIRSRRRKGAVTSNRTKKQTVPAHQRRHRQQPPSVRRADITKIGFGDLPAELRNAIYELALKPVSGRSVRIVQQPPGHTGKELALGLLCTCKAVRREAWPFLYERNEFRIDCIKLPRTIVSGGGYEPGQRPVFATSDGHPKNYEADLKRFIDCTNHKRALHSIRTITFAYYRCSPWSEGDADVHVSAFPECAHLVFVLKLLPKKPYYSFTPDLYQTQEHRPDKVAKALEHLDCMVRGTFEPERGPKRFCRTAVEAIADQMHWTCRHFDVGA